MSDPVPIRRKTSTGAGRITILTEFVDQSFDVKDWSFSRESQTLSLWCADGHQEHIILAPGDRYAFYPA